MLYGYNSLLQSPSQLPTEIIAFPAGGMAAIIIGITVLSMIIAKVIHIDI